MKSPHTSSRSRRQRGVVLFIALIVMVAMSLAAIALIRSVDTTNLVIGNLAFRQASILPANFAVEQAAAALFADVNPTGVPTIRSDRRPAGGELLRELAGQRRRARNSDAAANLTTGIPPG